MTFPLHKSNPHLVLKNKVKEFRSESGLSQQELADAVGTTRQTINALETGKFSASAFLAYKLIDYFGCEMRDLFYMDNEAK